MSAFEVGEKVTYYPIPKTADDRRHWPAEIKAQTKSRYRVEIQMPDGFVTRSVTAKRLAHQSELSLA